jgi:subtilisin family serine protease
LHLTSHDAPQLPPKTSEQWHLAGAQCTWDTTMGARVVIAVMDTGCDLSHPDLLPNAWVNPGEIPGNGVDDDGNGHLDDVHGWNFGSDSDDLTDGDGHGTHVASVAAGAGVARVSGVSPGAKVMCLKVQDGDGKLFASYMFAAYQYALDNGAHIVVNSFSNTYWSVPTGAARAPPSSAAWLSPALTRGRSHCS